MKKTNNVKTKTVEKKKSRLAKNQPNQPPLCIVNCEQGEGERKSRRSRRRKRKEGEEHKTRRTKQKKAKRKLLIKKEIFKITRKKILLLLYNSELYCKT